MTAAPRRAAVLGSPVAHSLSPALHRAAYAELGFTTWSYGRHEVDERGLPGFLRGLGPQWAGLSLTMPLKRAVIPLLDGVTDTARRVEAVNTVVFTDDGGRLGYNTDIPGMVAALREAGSGTLGAGASEAGPAVILGAGATAASALAALAALGVREAVVHVRGPARAALMRTRGERLGVRVRTADWSTAARTLCAPLVIATTPAGATDALADAVPERPGILFDVLYEPWPTSLAARWKARGGTVVGGLDLLVRQAALQVERMTGRAAPFDAMRRAGHAALRARDGGPVAVLVGPMGVGKSTVGRLLADRLGLGFRDTDDDIVTGQGRSIEEIFTERGEPAFRAIEKEAVRRALTGHGGVLALGGGAVLDADTRTLLAGTRVIHLSMGAAEAARRDSLDAARPLLAADPLTRWRGLARARQRLYEEVADVVVATDGRTPEEVGRLALDALGLGRA